MRDGFARRDGASVVVSSDFPEAALARMVCETGLPLLVVADDPAVFLDWTMRSRDLSADLAARLCSRVYAALAPNVGAAHRLAVGREDSPERIVGEIVEFLWPGRQAGLARATYAHLAGAGKIGPAVTQETTVDAAALASYAGLAEGLWPDEIVWPLALFNRPDGRSWRRPIDLTGPARVVLYGPYLHLPVGDWTARVEFEIDGAVSGVEAVTDVRIGAVVAEKAFDMPAKGIFAYALDFRVDDPHQPVEIRLFLKKGAIEGVLLPRSVTMRARR
jgi:hypothetical protein